MVCQVVLELTTMHAKYGQLKKIRCHVNPPVGNFALEIENDQPKDVFWDHCREQFAAKFNESIIGFYFSHQIGKFNDIAEFINKFELIVGVLNRSCFSRTEKQSVLWIEPSEFWRNCQMKQSLLTIILRCATNYDLSIDNFDDTLFGNYKENTYLRETKSALLRFMFGFTKFTGTTNYITNATTFIKHGWKEEFSKLDNCTVRRKLISPGENTDFCIIGVESLWL